MPNHEITASSEPVADLALSAYPLSDEPPPPNPKHGASVEFLGIVRDLEDGRRISGIEYRAYAPMVEAKLAQIAREGMTKHAVHCLKIHHCTGFVPAAKASVVIRVTTPHSQAAFDICREYLHRLKTEVPIWKHIQFAEPEH
ncbi:MAG: molybdopterin synthase catalytic subunit [Pseudoalteromonas tetraodonis]|jgi:molybdopterin synthase catalytic subunit